MSLLLHAVVLVSVTNVCSLLFFLKSEKYCLLDFDDKINAQNNFLLLMDNFKSLLHKHCYDIYLIRSYLWSYPNLILIDT